MKNKIKRVLSMMTAIALVMTSVLTADVTNAYAASSSKAIKSVTLKIGSSNVTKKTKTLTVGSSATLKVTVKPSSAKKKVTYKSSKTSVATVSSKGKIVAKKAGTAKITVTVTGKNNKKKSTYCNIKVKSKEQPTEQPTERPTEQPDVKVTGVTLEQADAGVRIAVNGTANLVASVAPANATNKNLVWSSSNTSVATVDNNGVVKGVKAGKVKVTVKTEDGGYTSSCTVKVVDDSTENVNGVEVKIQNNMKDHANTVFTGTDADVLVRVVKDEVPVGNTKVTLKLDTQYGNGAGYFGIIGDNVVTTDEDGYASFVVGLKDQYDYKATSGIYESYTVTATAVGSNEPASTTLSFAAIALEDTVVLNNVDYSLKDIVPSDNAADGDDGIDSTKSINGSSNVQYVSSQQVSLEDENSVRISSAPYIVLPQTNGDVKIGEYSKEINQTQSEYSVYNDATNETTTTVVKEVPAGLQYITLHFSDINISEYSKLVINTYDSEALVSPLTTYTYYHENEETLKDSVNGIQIPIQTKNNNNVYVVVSIVSPGQVNDDDNNGYKLDKITGVWRSASANYMTEEEIDGTVKWETEDIIYSNPIDMPYEMAAKYVPAVDLNENYSYSYKVPSFPSTGDAIITVKDINGTLVNYYFFPTENEHVKVDVYSTNSLIRYKNPETGAYEYNTGNVKYNAGSWYYYYNRNVIKDSTEGVAFKATAAETKNVKSDVTTEGNVVIVNSKLSGHTGLKATIAIDGVKDTELNITNGAVIRTSVQWSPVPVIEDTLATEFYALSTETVDVVATVTDPNGNRQSGVEVIFKDSDNDNDKLVINEQSSNDPIKDGSIVTAAWATSSNVTDNDGNITLKLKANSSEGYIYGLKAECADSKYIVSLKIKDTGFKVANIHWVDPGLSFVEDSTDGHDSKDNQSVSTFGKKDQIVTLDPRENGNNWIFGVKVVGRMLDNNNNDKVTKITGIAVGFDKEKEDESTKIDETSVQNGVSTGVASARLMSTGINTTKLTCGFTNKSLYKDETLTDINTITYEIEDQFGVVHTYVDCGYDPSNGIDTSMELDIPWAVNNVTANLIFPDGAQLTSDANTHAYIALKDTNGNPCKGLTVSYTVTENGKSIITNKSVTNEDGLIDIELSAPNKECERIISYAVDGISRGTTGKTIKYTASDAEFGVAGAKLENITAGDNAVIDVTFTGAIREVKPEMFTVKSGNTTYTVESAAVSSAINETNIVKLKLNTQATTAIQTEKAPITVSVSSAKVNGIEYQPTSAKGKVLGNKNTAVFKAANEYAINAEYNATTKKISVTITNNDNQVVTDNLSSIGNGSLVAYSTDASGLNKGTGVVVISDKTREITLDNTFNGDVLIFYCGASASVKVTK